MMIDQIFEKKWCKLSSITNRYEEFKKFAKKIENIVKYFTFFKIVNSLTLLAFNTTRLCYYVWFIFF